MTFSCLLTIWRKQLELSCWMHLWIWWWHLYNKKKIVDFFILNKEKTPCVFLTIVKQNPCDKSKYWMIKMCAHRQYCGTINLTNTCTAHTNFINVILYRQLSIAVSYVQKSGRPHVLYNNMYNILLKNIFALTFKQYNRMDIAEYSFLLLAKALLVL